MEKQRRRVAAAAAAVATAVPLVVIGSGGPAQAADTFQCSGTGTAFAVEPDGDILRYPLTAPGTNSAQAGRAVDIGGGWTVYPRILGGPDGRVYGINTTGMYRYRYNGSSWDVGANNEQATQISSGFASYANNTYRDKITVDEIGDFYLVDGNGRLRWYRYNEVSKVWTIAGRTIDTGWSRYNLIVAAGPGVLYGRTPDGKLFRSRFEPTSQRWIVQHEQVGTSGWQAFTKGIFSVGGDTLFGIRANGQLSHYRLREDDKYWVVPNREAGSAGWQNFTNVFATTNTCKLTDRHEPALPDTPIQKGSPVSVIQRPPNGTALGALEYVYPDDGGRLRHAYQPDPNDFNLAQWWTLPSAGAFTGRTSLVINPQNEVRLLAQDTSSNVTSFTRQAAPSTSWNTGTPLGGALASSPVAVRLSDGTPAAFGLDAGGALWARQHEGTTGDLDLLPWRKIGGSGLTGELTTVAGPDRKVTIFALDADGTPVTASYVDGTLSAWTELGGTGFTATPTVVTLPGPVQRVFARAADGQIQTQRQGTNGAWPGTWEPVGTFTSAGAPAAVLDPPTGRLVVVARGTDNEIHRVFETAIGTATWGDWLPLNSDFSDPSATDPTIAEYANTSGQSYLIVFRNPNDSTRIYARQTPTGSAARKAAAKPDFAVHQLPAPKK
jgi:hypothetical protein